MGTTLVDVEEKVNQSSSPASGTSDGTAGAERGNRLERGAALQVPTVAESQFSIVQRGERG